MTRKFPNYQFSKKSKFNKALKPVHFVHWTALRAAV